MIKGSEKVSSRRSRGSVHVKDRKRANGVDRYERIFKMKMESKKDYRHAILILKRRRILFSGSIR